jgi:Tfp pilus assembly protein PilF
VEYRVTDFLENKAEDAEESGDLNTAFELWKLLAASSQDPVFFCNYGRVAEKLEKWDEAEKAFAAALRIDPNFSLAMEGMGSLWFTRTDASERESFQTAKQWFLKALKYERNARVLTFLGATYVALDEITAARGALEEAIRIGGDSEEALYDLAKIEKERDGQKAIELLEKAIQIDPKYSLAHQELGKLYQHAGDLIRAEYHLRRAVETDPTNYWSQLFLANLLAIQGKNAEAEQTYRFVTSLHPENTGGTEFFARFLESIGKKREAAELRSRTKGRELS